MPVPITLERKRDQEHLATSISTRSCTESRSDTMPNVHIIQPSYTATVLTSTGNGSYKNFLYSSFLEFWHIKMQTPTIIDTIAKAVMSDTHKAETSEQSHRITHFSFKLQDLLPVMQCSADWLNSKYQLANSRQFYSVQRDQ